MAWALPLGPGKVTSQAWAGSKVGVGVVAASVMIPFAPEIMRCSTGQVAYSFQASTHRNCDPEA